MKKLLLAVVLLISMKTFAQDDDRFYDWNTHTDYARMKYQPNDDITYRGRMSFNEMKNLGEFDWVRDGATSYIPNESRIAYLKNNMEPYEIVVFMAMWDKDSHAIVPALYKVLNEANYWGDYTMYSVNRAITTKHNQYAQYHISQVPTIILLRDNHEIGRIDGKPNYSLEDDLTAIIEKDQLNHPYK